MKRKSAVEATIVAAVFLMSFVAEAGQAGTPPKAPPPTPPQKSAATTPPAAAAMSIEAQLATVKKITPIPKARSFCNVTIDIGAVFSDLQRATLGRISNPRSAEQKQAQLASLATLYNAMKCTRRSDLREKFATLFNDHFAAFASECSHGSREACTYLKASMSLPLMSASILKFTPSFMKDPFVQKALAAVNNAPSIYAFNLLRDTAEEVGSDAADFATNLLQIDGIYDGQHCFSPSIALAAPRCAKAAIDAKLSADRLAGKDIGMLEAAKRVADADNGSSKPPTNPSEAREAARAAGFGGGGAGPGGGGGTSGGFGGFGGGGAGGLPGGCGLPAFEGMLSRAMACMGGGVLGQIMGKLAAVTSPSNVTTLRSGNCLAGDTGDGASGDTGGSDDSGPPPEDLDSAAERQKKQDEKDKPAKALVESMQESSDPAVQQAGNDIAESSSLEGMAEGGPSFETATGAMAAAAEAYEGSEGLSPETRMAQALGAMLGAIGPGAARDAIMRNQEDIQKRAREKLTGGRSGTPRPDGDCSSASAALSELNCVMGTGPQEIGGRGVGGGGGGDPNPEGGGGRSPMGGGQGAIPGCVDTMMVSHVCGRDDGCPEREAGMTEFVYVDRLGGDVPSEFRQLNTAQPAEMQQQRRLQNQQLNSAAQQQMRQQQNPAGNTGQQTQQGAAVRGQQPIGIGTGVAAPVQRIQTGGVQQTTAGYQLKTQQQVQKPAAAAPYRPPDK